MIFFFFTFTTFYFYFSRGRSGSNPHTALPKVSCLCWKPLPLRNGSWQGNVFPRSKNFLKSERKQDPRPALFPAPRFLRSLHTHLTAQVLKIFIIALNSLMGSYLSNLSTALHALSGNVTLWNQKQKKIIKNFKKGKINHGRICFLTRQRVPIGGASWCLTCCCVKTVSSVFHREIMPSNSAQLPIQFAPFGSARGPAPFSGGRLTK